MLLQGGGLYMRHAIANKLEESATQPGSQPASQPATAATAGNRATPP
jgi:hypothetical protein